MTQNQSLDLVIGEYYVIQWGNNRWIALYDHGPYFWVEGTEDGVPPDEVIVLARIHINPTISIELPKGLL